MRSLYRRAVKIKLVAESQAAEAHGWATSVSDAGEVQRHYFTVDQPRFITRLRQVGVQTLKLQFERLKIHPESITIKYPHNTFTSKLN
jgi:hypothetical protein